MFNKTNHPTPLLALALAGSVLLTGCLGGGGSSSSSTTTTTTTPTTGSIKFANSSTAGYAIDAVYASLSSSGSWGVKQNTSAIASGSSLTLTSVPPGTYDAKVASLGTVSTYYAYARGFAVTAGNTYTVTATDTSYTGSLFVTNNSVYTITAVYVSTAGLGVGANQLTTSLAPGSTFHLTNIPSGSYYVRGVTSAGNYDTSTPASIPSHGNYTLTAL